MMRVFISVKIKSISEEIRVIWSYVTLIVDIDMILQHGRIACYAERCISHGNSVRLSICLSHAGILSSRTKIGSCGLQKVAQKANLSFKNKFRYISIIDEASDFKFGTSLSLPRPIIKSYS